MEFVFILTAVLALSALIAIAALAFKSGLPLVMAPVGIVLLGIGSLGALHAWGEGRSLGWTVGYGAIAVVGIAAPFVVSLTTRRVQE